MTSRPWSLLACALAALSCSACTGWQSAMDPQGLPAFKLHALMSTIMIGCAIVWLLVVIVLALALWRPRSTRSPSRPVPEKRMAVILSSALVATVMIITAFTVGSFLTTRALSNADPDALLIKVRGYQWWWEFDYLDATDRRDLSRRPTNSTSLLAGACASCSTRRTSFTPSGFQALRARRTSFQAATTRSRLRPSGPDVTAGNAPNIAACSTRIWPSLWSRIRRTRSRLGKTPNASRRREPVGDEATEGLAASSSQKPCAACHTIRGTPASGTLGPDLTHVASRQFIAAGELPTTRGSLAAWIADPQTIKPGNNMPMVPLSRDELLDVSAYLASLR